MKSVALDLKISLATLFIKFSPLTWEQKDDGQMSLEQKIKRDCKECATNEYEH